MKATVIILDRKMVDEKRIRLLKGETEKFRQLLAAGEMLHGSDLQKYFDCVDALVLDASLLDEEYQGYKASYERLDSGLAALTSLGTFQVQQTVLDHWTIEHKGSVVASGSSLVDAAHDLNKSKPKIEDLASLPSGDL